MIRTFADDDTERLFRRERIPHFASFENVARRKLALLDAATSLAELSRIPGNRLEKLPEYAGKYSIRINDQFRILFSWKAPDAFDVQIIDYH